MLFQLLQILLTGIIDRKIFKVLSRVGTIQVNKTIFL